MPNSDEGVRVPLGISDLPSHGLFAQDPPAELYHYTSLQGAHGIITSKQLWLTKIQHLNDMTELRYAIDLFRHAVVRWQANLDAEERAFIDRGAHQLGSFTGTNICVASFCADGDLLSQWRAYGAEATGVALGFSGSYLKGLSNRGFLRTWKCIYDPGDHETIIRELVEMALHCFNMRHTLSNDAAKQTFAKEIIGWFNTTFLRVAPVLKDRNFHEEKEWRIISTSIKSTNPDYDIVSLGSRQMPIFRLNFPVAKDGTCGVLSRIRLGPTGDRDAMSKTLVALLQKHGHSRISIQPSSIPYRAPR